MTQANDPKSRSSKGLSGEEIRLWRDVTKRDVVLPGRIYRADTEPPSSPKPKGLEHGKATDSVPIVKTHPTKPPEIPVGASLDKRTAQKLRRGQIPIEARIDLHGMTQPEAHTALSVELERAQSEGHRCLLVITGKGTRRENGGVLKVMVPRWLNESVNKARVLAIQGARPQHGGEGAVYVLLRKQR